MAVFEKRSTLGAPARDVFAWHRRPEALRALVPPWERVVVEQVPASLGDGERAVLRMAIGPFAVRWVAEHRGFVDRGDEGGEFTDVQVSGPFAAWTHRHRVAAAGPGACTLEDRVEYELPFGRLGHALGGALVRRRLERMFAYRHDATRAAVEAARRADPGDAGSPSGARSEAAGAPDGERDAGGNG